MEPEVLEHILDGRRKPTKLQFSLLMNITENFSEEREIDKGGFATVYKGVLPNGNVSVKRIMNKHTIDDAPFYREVDILLAVNHPNIVQFLGYCASTDLEAHPQTGSKAHIYAEEKERLLCFEYIGNGSLQEHITNELRGLEWNTRYAIIKGICNGLDYLLNVKNIYHMDLKPANVLLDSNMVPKITDFGQSRYDEKSQTISMNRYGSRGYCPPEYTLFGHRSSRSDIYSLGTIIIELVTGHREIPNNSKSNVLRRWRHRWRKTGMESPLSYQQVIRCIDIGLLCQEIEPCNRPFIREIVRDINEMDVTNTQISNDNESTVGQIRPYSDDDMLGIEPLELHFPFELNKEMSCSLQLTNETDSYIAFEVQKMSPLPCCTEPHQGIVLPRSKCSVDITLQPPDKAPQRASEFIVRSTKVNYGITAEDITTSMFSRDTGNVVDEVNLDVVFDKQLQTESVQFRQELENTNEVIPASQELHNILEKNQDSSNAKLITYNLEFLQDITYGFSQHSELRRDEYGVVYKGILPSGQVIVMRNLSRIHLLDDRTFQNAISFLTKIKHQNLVQLIGYCAESVWEKSQPSGSSIRAEVPKRLLCSEYVGNGSLDEYLDEDKSPGHPVNWDTRFKIILGICMGLHYLHKLYIQIWCQRLQSLRSRVYLAKSKPDCSDNQLWGHMDTWLQNIYPEVKYQCSQTYIVLAKS
ncbi:unnamed protein product [Alopecurus aequalis]